MNMMLSYVCFTTNYTDVGCFDLQCRALEREKILDYKTVVMIIKYDSTSQPVSMHPYSFFSTTFPPLASGEILTSNHFSVVRDFLPKLWSASDDPSDCQLQPFLIPNSKSGTSLENI